MLLSATQYLGDTKIPLIPFTLAIILIVALIIGIIIENVRQRNNIISEDDYFQTIMFGDDAKAKSRFRKYDRYFMFKFKDGEKNGYYLNNVESKAVYETYVVNKSDNKTEYTFKNLLMNREHSNKIGEITKNSNGVSTFMFDQTDIWEFMKNRGVSFQITNVNENIALYSIDTGNGKKAYARSDKSKESAPVFSIKTNDKDIGYLFLLFFAFAITDR